VVHRVVPVAVEVVLGERDSGQLLVGDLDPGRVVAGVEVGPDLQPRLVRRRADEVDDDLVAGEGPGQASWMSLRS